ncbi:hypothetical protein [Actinophytocola sp.]|uniref:hypothetical protein n=1 Tax=Actinophytocola sp. TaxID=1872138 RepID=UPI00389A1425
MAALTALVAGQEPDLHGLPVRLSHDFAATLLTGEPGWGTIAVRGAPTLLIEVPHPGSDRYTARLGLDLFHAIPTAALLVAGTHRRHADVAHEPDSLFHAFAQALATTELQTAELQLHGFAATSAPGTDVVLTPGAGRPTGLHHALRESLTCRGFRVRHHEHLAGRTNAQGIAAAARGTPFLHLELAPPLRSDHRDRVVEAVTDAWHQRCH